MPEQYFSLSSEDKKALLGIAAAESGRPAALLEKDIWVVWVLSALFQSRFGSSITFKGGTSLSKAYGVIDRFSEDLDLTYDIRQIIPDLVGGGPVVPGTNNQAAKWTKAVNERLPGWIESEIKPIISEALAREGINAVLRAEGKESLLLEYPVETVGAGYATPYVRMEFGARASGEPHQPIPVTCDARRFIPGSILLPEATPLVMSIDRTFWEKLTAAHVFCLQGRLRGERFSRHWYDLAMIAESSRLTDGLAGSPSAIMVIEHKNRFFREKDAVGSPIDYKDCLRGKLELVPQGATLKSLVDDYALMVKEGMLYSPRSFDSVIEKCAEISTEINNSGK